MRARRGFGAAVALCLPLITSILVVPVPASAADDLTVGSNATAWPDPSGGFNTVHISGEVTNSAQSGSSYQEVMVKCNLLDALGGVTDTDTEPTRARILKPGETAPFDDAFPNAGPYHHFACSTWGAPTTTVPNHNFSSTVTSVVTGSDGHTHVLGTVENLGSAEASSVAVIITAYDGAGGNVVDSLTAPVEGAIPGNSTTTFDTIPVNDRPWAGATYGYITEARTPVVQLSDGDLSFGEQVQGTGSAAQGVYVNNVGTGDLHVGSVSLGGANPGDYSSGLQDGCSGRTVVPGGSCRLAVRFTPQNAGASSATLGIPDDAGDSPQAVALSGNGLKRPAISLSQSSLDFGPQVAGTSADTTVQVTSTGLDPVSISSITVDNMRDFGVDGTACLSVSLQPGTSCQLTVSFHPLADGVLSGTITLTHNGRSSPGVLGVVGTGSHAVPAASFSPDHLAFGAQLLGTHSAAQPITLTNTGTAALSISAVSPSTDYTQTNDCIGTLAARASCTISVTFTPSATGERPGTLRVTDNAAGGMQVLPLSGTGITETDFYFAEGFTGPGFHETLSLLMPKQGGQAVVDYFMNGGAHITRYVDLSPGTVTRVDVNRAVGPNQEVSIRVKLPFPGVAERIMHFRSGQWYGSTDFVGVTRPSSEWNFAEGSTLSFFSEYLTLQNPNPDPVVVDLHYFMDSKAPSTKTITLLGTSRTTIAVFSDPLYGVGPGIAGVSVQAVARNGAQIIAERPFYVNGFSFGSGSIRDGHVAFGATAPATSWNFAEGTTLPGFNEYLTLENPGSSDATVALTYIDDQGTVTPKTIAVTHQTRATVQVFDTAFGVGPGHAGVSVQITSDQPIVAERPMYSVHDFGSGTVAGASVVVGSTTLGTLFGFADTSTVAGENDFLTIQNPGTAIANVKITYHANGNPVERKVAVDPHKRLTVAVFGSAAGGGLGPGVPAAGVVLSSDQPILVEKPTYSANADTFGATDTLGYSPPGF